MNHDYDACLCPGRSLHDLGYCKPSKPVKKQARITIIKEHGNLDVFVTEFTANEVVKAWKDCNISTISFFNYQGDIQHHVLRTSISSISVDSRQ